MRLTLRLIVEHEDARFEFGEAPKAMVRIAQAGERLQRETTVLIVDSEQVPEMVDAICAWFDEAIRGWSGLQDDDGNAIPFAPEYVRDLPMELKVQIAQEALSRRGEALGKGLTPAVPATGSMP